MMSVELRAGLCVQLFIFTLGISMQGRSFCEQDYTEIANV